MDTVFASADNDWKFRVVTQDGHILGMSFQGLDACFVLIVPDLYKPIIIKGKKEAKYTCHQLH